MKQGQKRDVKKSPFKINKPELAIFVPLMLISCILIYVLLSLFGEYGTKLEPVFYFAAFGIGGFPIYLFFIAKLIVYAAGKVFGRKNEKSHIIKDK